MSSGSEQFTSGPVGADAPNGTDPRRPRTAAEEAALRRVAALAASSVSREELFAAVSQALAPLVGADTAALLRFEPDETVTLLGAWNPAGEPVHVCDREPVNAVLRQMRDSGQPLRCGAADIPLTGPFISEIRRLRIRGAIAAPIQIGGRVWGACVAASQNASPFPRGTETRMLELIELMAG